ncbi:Protein of unknown function [Pyronema omphalodes CBS 100304]|uniref:Uncharacterized protein n=1 Tax=Pyronema omphalodes (strain CBS 100304) TaxID=1076935 RepID=U4LXK5_PYROM|nr:Protein of unknown function [Pyronema omphalodes CBS 100304]
MEIKVFSRSSWVTSDVIASELGGCGAAIFPWFVDFE